MPLVRLGDQLVGRERFVRRIAPELAAHARVHRLGEGFGEAVGERLDQDRRIIVVGALEALGDGVVGEAGGDDEGADIVVGAARSGRDEIGERDVGLVHRGA